MKHVCYAYEMSHNRDSYPDMSTLPNRQGIGITGNPSNHNCILI